MTPSKQEILMQGQTGVAKKVYECVPINEPWTSFQVMTAMRNLTGSTPDNRIVSGCLVSLVDSGLVKKSGRDQFQRIPVDIKQKTQVPAMTKAQPKLEVVADQKVQGGPLEMLSELAGEIAGMANSLKRLAGRVEDVALAVEHEREGNAEAVGKLKQLQELLKGISQ
ncbi:Phage protein [Pseudomonas chlororaphis subsp. aureofaciens]|uniref:hypothetical protein n=1 Tax=Pseudomonas chlororaphis TaxID=587753 RepID=UPI000F587550|nr:hypothetical protein [Pseudomonas chlororaphis]AZD86536.1 Phage protein [Pseudomonas chlororaphis subsp. aureofaciens]